LIFFFKSGIFDLPILKTLSVLFTLKSFQVAGQDSVNIFVYPTITDSATIVNLSLRDSHGKKINMLVVIQPTELKNGSFKTTYIVTVGSTLEEIVIVSGGLFFL
jgi:hypothetical protein